MFCVHEGVYQTTTLLLTILLMSLLLVQLGNTEEFRSFMSQTSDTSCTNKTSTFGATKVLHRSAFHEIRISDTLSNSYEFYFVVLFIDQILSSKKIVKRSKWPNKKIGMVDALRLR
jgi:hypothetical protein